MSGEHRDPLTTGALEVDDRAGGLRRVTSHRVVDARCQGCRRRFTNTGAASTHARSSGHTVSCWYESRFAFVPTPQAGGAG